MLISLPLKDMTIEETIQAMESIWEDLCKNADSLSSPEWHKDVLKMRERMLNDGNDQFVDWETEKKNIEDTIFVHAVLDCRRNPAWIRSKLE